MAAQTESLLRAYRERGDAAARARVIEEHLPLVASVARRYAGSGEPLEDLVQVGTIGLIKAVDRFEPERGLELSTLAVPWIEGEIRHHLRDRAAPMRTPRPVRELAQRLRAAQAELGSREGRSPTVAELAAAVGAEEQAVVDALAARDPTSLPEADAAGPDEPHEATEARALLARGWRAVPERERRILELRFFADRSQAEIAREVGLSQAHVSRLIQRGLARLRAELAEQPAGAVADAAEGAYSGRGMATREAQADQQQTHSGRLLVRMPQSLHAELARAAEREGVSLNTLITGALAAAVGWRNEAEPDEGPPESPASAPPPAADRPRWLFVALAANLIVVALAAILAVILLIAAWA